jgi:hypothetical protein
MIAQHIAVARYFEKADRIGDYDQLRKIFFGIKRQAMACASYKKCGSEHGCLSFIFLSRLGLSAHQGVSVSGQI